MSISKAIDKRAARKAENRTAIMDAAEAIVLEGGAKALTANALAARSGVSRRTIFNHFPSIEAAVTERLNEYLDRIFEVVPQYCTPIGTHPEREMLERLRASFTIEKLKEHVAPYSQLFFAFQDFTFGFNAETCRYNPHAFMASIDQVIDNLWADRQDIPRLRLANFVNILADAVGEGVAEFFRQSAENPSTFKDVDRMRECILESLDYIQKLIEGTYA